MLRDVPAPPDRAMPRDASRSGGSQALGLYQPGLTETHGLATISPSWTRPAGMTRHLSLGTVRDAASVVYDMVSRTPLVRLELPGRAARGQPHATAIFLKLEMLQPTGVLQDPWCLQCRATAVARATVAGRVDRERRQRRSGRGPRRAQCGCGMLGAGGRDRADDQASCHRAARCLYRQSEL